MDSFQTQSLTVAAKLPSPPNCSVGSDRFRSSLTIPSLDGIRALAFGTVFLGHVGLGRVFPAGFGVTVFFFLSGYLITTLLRVENAKNGRLDIKRFYLRRALRILPPFYLVLTAAICLNAVGLLGGSLSLGALLYQYCHLTNYYVICWGEAGIIAGTGVLWSLAVEEHFYLIFPLLYSKIANLLVYKQTSILLAICGCTLLWRCVLSCGFHVAPARYNYFATDARVDSILFGCLFAIAANPMLDLESPLSYSRSKRLAPLAVLGLVITYWGSDTFRDTVRYSIQGFALMPLFVLAIKSNGSMLFRILNHRISRFLGELSFTLYLVHASVFDIVNRVSSGPALLKGVSALAISLMVAVVVHFAIELPCQKLRRKLSAYPIPGERSDASLQKVPALQPSGARFSSLN